SRSLFHSGNAVKLAAEDAKRQLEQLRRELSLPADCPVAEVFKKKYGMRAGSVMGGGNFIPPYTPPDENGQTDNATPFWMVGATGVEVEVDTETGRVKVTRMVNVADVGTPINPKIVETQLSGASIMQLGFTLFEKMLFDGQGLCGCCTVIVNGTAVSGCLYLAQLADGAKVQTVEEGGELDEVQEAFIERAAFQCGFCTPGFVLMTRQLLDEHPHPDDEQIR